MVLAELPFVTQAHHPQGGRDRPFASGHDGPDEQDLSFDPGWLREHWSEWLQQGNNGSG
jgi:hypothetical protein